jgi:preflagellin peptidase FlaK
VDILETITLLDVSRLIIGIIILTYASYTDLKTRCASNYLWVIMGITGAIILAIEYFIVGFANPMYLIFIPIMIGLVYLLFQLRLIFGGADAKAIMAISILVPFPIYNLPLSEVSVMPGSWQVFANSIILFLFIPLSLLIFNISKRKIEFPYLFLGYKMKVEKAREKFVWPLEKIEDGKRKFVYMPKDFDIDEELDEFEKNNIKEIWVTPKIPFMIPLLFGFICTFLIGDIMFSIMNFFI